MIHVNLTDYLINVTQFVSSQKFELTYQVLFCKCVDIVTRWICWHPSSLMNTFCCELDTFQRQFAVVHIYSSASLRKAKKSFATSLPWLKSHMLSRIHFTELKWEYFIEFPTFWQWPWAINSLISANYRRNDAKVYQDMVFGFWLQTKILCRPIRIRDYGSHVGKVVWELSWKFRQLYEIWSFLRVFFSHF